MGCGCPPRRRRLRTEVGPPTKSTRISTSCETVGRNDPERQKVADDLTRQIERWENRDRTLARLQEYEERRLQERTRQRQAELLRRLNIVSPPWPAGPRLSMYSGPAPRGRSRRSIWRPIRCQLARQEFAAAAGVELNALPPLTPVKWADVSGHFENFIKSAKAPVTEDETLAEIKRMQELEYIDPNSAEGQAYQEKFNENLQAAEADYCANVMPRTFDFA